MHWVRPPQPKMQIKVRINIYNYFFFISIFLAACGNDSELSSFTSDECSLFPDSSVISNKDWCECCFQHDLAYWRGGTEKEREIADDKLKECVLERTGDKTLAKVMHDGKITR